MHMTDKLDALLSQMRDLEDEMVRELQKKNENSSTRFMDIRFILPKTLDRSIVN